MQSFLGKILVAAATAVVEALVARLARALLDTLLGGRGTAAPAAA